VVSFTLWPPLKRAVSSWIWKVSPGPLFMLGCDRKRHADSTFANDVDGRRPVFGGAGKFQDDPKWHDCILFHEYLHGDNGAGIGASHQTGWTGIVAKLIEIFGYMDPHLFLDAPDYLQVSEVVD
jgi:hypothetical protein